MRKSGWVVLSVLLAVPGVAAGQQLVAQDTVRPRDPIAVMLAHRADLALKADQVSKLEGIQKKLSVAAAPLRKRLEGFRADRPAQAGAFLDMTEVQRQQLMAKREEVRRAALELRQLNRAAGVQAHAVLTAEQQAKLHQMMRRQGGRAGMRAGPGMWQGRGMRAGGMWRGRSPRGGSGFGPPGN